MQAIGRALARIAHAEPTLQIVFPIHLNPVVREAIRPAVAGLPNVRLIEPLPYGAFCHLINRASVVLTDSGGVQEEAPSLGKSVLVMRETTERPEGIAAGTARLVGPLGATDRGAHPKFGRPFDHVFALPRVKKWQNGRRKRSRRMDTASFAC